MTGRVPKSETWHSNNPEVKFVGDFHNIKRNLWMEDFESFILELVLEVLC